MKLEAYRNAEKRGRRAEDIAAMLLRLKGYRILERRYKSPVGEIDIIARRGALLIFAEVKYRSSIETCLDAISTHQQARLSRAALAYVSRHTDFAALDQRIDAILLAPWTWPVHMRNIL